MTLTAGHGEWLERWFERLDTHGFRVGVRERLLVQAYLAQRAAAGALADDPRAMLASVAPLLCGSPSQQTQYEVLLTNFSAAAGLAPGLRSGALGRRQQPPAWLLARTLGVVLILAQLPGSGVWEPTPPPGTDAALPPASAPAPLPLASSVGVYVHARPMVLHTATQVLPDWATPLRAGLAVLGTLAALTVAAAAWKRLRRDAVLAHARTPEAVDEHVLHGGERPTLGPSPALARGTARALRQRIAGSSQVLDMVATLRATVRAAGALSPVWLPRSRTPEYLALVDRRHPRDHAAPLALDVLHALAASGVVADIWHFEGSPEHGLWPAREGARRTPRTSFAELAARHAGQRVLVWAEADTLLDGAGRPQPWTRALPLLAERAWFSPLPLNAWGATEDAVDAQGFLLLPALPGALPALAGWLAGGRASLDVPSHWPLRYPVLLRDAPSSWVTRVSPPPPGELDDLRFQLRSALGPEYHRWLCGCAIFPVLAPSLTLALGRMALPAADDDELAAGYAALAVLPWFRHGRMPDWLREVLLDALPDDAARALREVVTRRLDQALQSGGERLAEVAIRRAWLHRQHGMAQDVLLARFLEDGELNRLTQRLPRALRQALFRDGLLLRGMRPSALAALVLPVLGGLWAASPLWPDLRRAEPVVPLLAIGPMINPSGEGQIKTGPAIAFGPDGTQLVGKGTPTPVWEARTGRVVAPADPLAVGVPKTLALHPLGSVRARIGSDGQVRLERADGQVIGLPLTPPGAVAVDFSPDGERLAVLHTDLSIHVYGRDWSPRLEVMVCDERAKSLAVISQDVAAAAAGSAAAPLTVTYSAAAWRALGDGTMPTPGVLAVGPGIVDPDGLRTRLEHQTGLSPKLQRLDALGDKAFWNVCDPPEVESETRSNNLTNQGTIRTSAYSVGLFIDSDSDDERSAINSKLQAMGYQLAPTSFTVSSGASQAWFAKRPTVFYYSPTSADAAGYLARALRPITGKQFVVQSGRGLNVSDKERASLFVVHLPR